MSGAVRPQPRGRLEAEPLPELLGRLLVERATAVVRLDLSSGPAEIYVTDGQPVAVELPGIVDRLGEVCVAAGLLEAETLRRMLGAPRPPGLLFGRMLVDAGLLTAQQLVAALRLQTRRRLHRLFFIDDGEFAVEHEEHGRGTEAGEPVLADLRRAVVQGVRSAWNDARHAPRLPAEPLVLAVPLSSLAAWGLTPEEQAIAAPLASGAGRVEAIAASPAERAIVYALLATGGLAREGAPLRHAPPSSPRLSGPHAPLRPSSSTPVSAPRVTAPMPSVTPTSAAAIQRPASHTAGSMPAAAPPRTTGSQPVTPPRTTGAMASALPPAARLIASPEDLSRALKEKRASVDGEDFFAVLGVDRDADRAAVKAAYLEAARIFHPDRLASAGLADLRADAEYVFRRVSEAHATLTDDGRRAAYVARIDRPPEADAGDAHAQRVLAAEMALVEGDIALKRRDYAQAIARLSEAITLNPTEGESVALLAWARFSAGQGTLGDVRGDFERAVVLSPKCARAHYYLGMVRKQAGELPGALASFRRAADLDARLAEAQSEARVLQARLDKDGGGKSGGGLFDRLRKK